MDATPPLLSSPSNEGGGQESRPQNTPTISATNNHNHNERIKNRVQPVTTTTARSRCSSCNSNDNDDGGGRGGSSLNCPCSSLSNGRIDWTLEDGNSSRDEMIEFEGSYQTDQQQHDFHDSGGSSSSSSSRGEHQQDSQASLNSSKLVLLPADRGGSSDHDPNVVVGGGTNYDSTTSIGTLTRRSSSRKWRSFVLDGLDYSVRDEDVHFFEEDESSSSNHDVSSSSHHQRMLVPMVEEDDTMMRTAAEQLPPRMPVRVKNNASISSGSSSGGSSTARSIDQDENDDDVSSEEEDDEEEDDEEEDDEDEEEDSLETINIHSSRRQIEQGGRDSLAEDDKERKSRRPLGWTAQLFRMRRKGDDDDHTLQGLVGDDGHHATTAPYCNDHDGHQTSGTTTMRDLPFGDEDPILVRMEEDKERAKKYQKLIPILAIAACLFLIMDSILVILVALK